MRLITIPISHYCERARWALDYCGVDYSEDQYLQLFHRRPVLRAGGRGTVPVLVDGDTTLADSGDILALADRAAPDDRKLYPDSVGRDAVAELDAELAGDYGVETRRWAYAAYFPHKRLLIRYNAGRAPRWQSGVLRATYPVVRRMMSRKLGLTPAKLDRAKALVDRTMDAVAERLADGRRYLLGDRFTAADLTFAALTAPIVMPPEYGTPLPTLDELPDPPRTQIEAFRAHPAGAFALRLYADHRRG